MGINHAILRLGLIEDAGLLINNVIVFINFKLNLCIPEALKSERSGEKGTNVGFDLP